MIQFPEQQQPDGTYRGRAIECDECGSTPDVHVVHIITGYAYPQMGFLCNECADGLYLPAWHGRLTPTEVAR